MYVVVDNTPLMDGEVVSPPFRTWEEAEEFLLDYIKDFDVPKEERALIQIVKA
jgi:hypothetical protein